jgi:dTDP-4-dehydrorhamnose reductase
MNILVTGSNGQLGLEMKWAVISRSSRLTCEIKFIDIETLDITNKSALERLIKEYRPDVVMNFAAYTTVDKAETEQDTAFSVNSTAVEYLSELSNRYQFFLLHISTDYVFDGKSHSPVDEDHPMAPESYYGLSKAAGEAQMRKICHHGAIIRTSWLYSSFGNNFVKTILKLAREKDELKVVNDQTGTPTYASDLAQFILDNLKKMLTVKSVETYHFSNSGTATWYDFACAIVELAHLPCRVLPVSTAEYPSAAPRPAYSVMSKLKIKEKFNCTPRHWEAALTNCLKELKII